MKNQNMPWKHIIEFHREIAIRSEASFFSFGLDDHGSERFSYMNNKVVRKMQVDARNYMDNMTRSAQNEALMNSQQLRDSVDKYIAEYSKKQGYTLVLRKAATWYVGDIDDITADVVKGLNARYNKVDTKK